MQRFGGLSAFKPGAIDRRLSRIDLHVWRWLEGLKQKEAAALFGVSQQALQQWERGARALPRGFQERFLRVMIRYYGYEEAAERLRARASQDTRHKPAAATNHPVQPAGDQPDKASSAPAPKPDRSSP